MSEREPDEVIEAGSAEPERGRDMPALPFSPKLAIPFIVVLGVVAVIAAGLFDDPGPQGAVSGPDSNSDITLAATDQILVDALEGQLSLIQAEWADRYAEAEDTYRPTELVVYVGTVTTACGEEEADVGAFYCPADERIYVDLDFYRALGSSGANGVDAQTYVVAHEVGHHLQTVEGIERQIQELKRQNPAVSEELDMRAELQADCLTGMWASGGTALDPGRFDRALTAVLSSLPPSLDTEDPDLVRLEPWTLAAAELRRDWFGVGFETNDPIACNTFTEDALANE